MSSIADRLAAYSRFSSSQDENESIEKRNLLREKLQETKENLQSILNTPKEILQFHLAHKLQEYVKNKTNKVRDAGEEVKNRLPKTDDLPKAAEDGEGMDAAEFSNFLRAPKLNLSKLFERRLFSHGEGDDATLNTEVKPAELDLGELDNVPSQLQTPITETRFGTVYEGKMRGVENEEFEMDPESIDTSALGESAAEAAGELGEDIGETLAGLA